MSAKQTPAAKLVSEEAIRRARLALARHPECFWVRRTDGPLADRDDVELVIRRLRENGGAQPGQTRGKLKSVFDSIPVRSIAAAGTEIVPRKAMWLAERPCMPTAQFVGAPIWAACAKDPGYNPILLLNQMQRNSRVNPAELREMGADFQPTELKQRWLELAGLAGSEIARATAADICLGLAFVNAGGDIGWFDMAGFKPHKAVLGGSLPRITGALY